MTHTVKIMNSRGEIVRQLYAVNITQAWVIRRKFTAAGMRGKIEVLL